VRLTSFSLGEGTVPTVVLHGFLGQGRNLTTLVRRWAQRAPHRRFLVPDLRGHGTSPAVDEHTSLGDLAQDVLETAAALGPGGPADWVGHSQGGRVALAALWAEPSKVRGVTLLDIAPGPIRPGGFGSGRLLQALVAAPAQTTQRRTLREHFLGLGIDAATTDWLMMNVQAQGDTHRWRIDRQALCRLHERLNAEDLWPAVEGGQGAKVRCIRGERSPYVTEQDVRRLREAGCEVHTVQAGHFVHTQALEALLALL
jgi:esterase